MKKNVVFMVIVLFVFSVEAFGIDAKIVSRVGNRHLLYCCSDCREMNLLNLGTLKIKNLAVQNDLMSFQKNEETHLTGVSLCRHLRHARHLEIDATTAFRYRI